MIVVLTGGTGGAKFVQGIARVRPPEELVFIVNTGDDLSLHGLHISPDVDSITYALAGLLSRERGWGVEADTFHCLDAMRRLGIPGWFQLGDRDLALHLFRTQLLSSGLSLSQATAVIVERLGIRSRILVMSDERVETRVQTNLGELSFQEYFVRERYTPAVQQVQFLGAESALPAPGVVDALLAAEAIVIAPSNPVTSIGPILAVPGIRQALCRTPASIAAISPIVGGAAVSGPAGALMAAQHLPVSIAGVAEAYADFLDVLIADQGDAVLRAEVERLGVRAEFTDTIMKSQSDKERLAGVALELALQPVASS